MEVFELDGAAIRTLGHFHAQMADCPTMPGFYGRNLDALWDALTGLIEGPLKIVWRDANMSRQALGSDFDRVIQIFREAEEARAPYPDKLVFELSE